MVITEQEKRESVIKEFKDNYRPYSPGYAHVLVRNWAVQDAIDLLESQEPITGETSDGYHTFNELYHHRAVLFSVIVNNYKDLAWKSVRHHDGTMYDGMFIVGIDTPDGQATYHYDINPYWDMFNCRVREFAPEWDGHTPAQAIERIKGLTLLKTQEPRVMTLEEVKKKIGSGEYVFTECEKEGQWMRYGDARLSVDQGDSCRIAFLISRRGDDPYVRWWWISYKNYNKTWRCWTSRQTEEEMEATPWNAQK